MGCFRGSHASCTFLCPSIHHCAAWSGFRSHQFRQFCCVGNSGNALNSVIGIGRVGCGPNGPGPDNPDGCSPGGPSPGAGADVGGRDCGLEAPSVIGALGKRTSPDRITRYFSGM